jgi:hypothetical protein
MHGTIEEDKPVQEEHKQNRHLRDVDIEVGVSPLLLKFRDNIASI